MKEQRSTVLWLFVVLAASCIVAWGGDLVVPYDPAAMHFNYTPEQAVEIARNWTGNPQVSVEFRGVYEDYPYVAPWYVLSTPDRVQGFYVDPHFGKVQGWQDDRTASLTLLHAGRQVVVERIIDRPLAVEMAQRIRARTGG